MKSSDKNKISYQISSKHLFVLKPDPIKYGDQVYEIEVNFIEDSIQNNPVQLAAIYWLQKLQHPRSTTSKNPLGELMFFIFNQETDDKLNYSMAARDDMENAAYDLYDGTIEETNRFLFESTETSMDELERIASEVLSAKDEDELREILIDGVLYEAMITNFDHWPLPTTIEQTFDDKEVARLNDKRYAKEFYDNLMLLLFNENPLYYCQLWEKKELEKHCYQISVLAVNDLHFLLDAGMDVETAKQQVSDSLKNTIPKPEPITYSNGNLVIPDWMFEREMELGIIIEDTKAYGDGKAIMRTRVNEHIRMVNSAIRGHQK